MSRSKKDGTHGGAHRNVRDKEYWKSRLHRGGEALGRVTKRLTHRLERRRAKIDLLLASPTREDHS